MILRKVLRLINNKYKDIPYLCYDEENSNIYFSKGFILSNTKDIKSIETFLNRELLDYINEVITINTTIYKNYRMGLYVKSKNYIFNYFDKIIEELTSLKNTFVSYDMINKVSSYDENILDIRELVLQNINEDSFAIDLMTKEIEYIDINKNENKVLIDKLKNKLKYKTDDIVKKNNKCKDIENIFDNSLIVMYRDGYTFKFNNRNVLINSDGIVYYENLPILNLGCDYVEILRNQLKYLKII